MKYYVRFYVIIFITFCSITNANTAELFIVYLNMNKVMNKTIAGKSLVEQLEKIHKANIVEFKKIEDNFKKEEVSVLSQKNILSQDEYNKKVNSLKNKINSYKNDRKQKIDLVSKKKIEATSLLLNEVEPLLVDYSKKNNISIILRKQDIVIARSDLDITNEIIDLVNSKIKKIKLN